MKFEYLIETIKYIFRLLIFCISIRISFLYVALCIANAILFPFQFIDWFNETEIPIELIDFFFFIVILPFVLIVAAITAYPYAKICSIFKKLDNLNKWQTFFGIVLISISTFIFTYIDIPFGENKEKDMLCSCIYVISVILAYILYIFLNFLTKKYPKPFEKIGYYSSLEFYKNTLKKIFKH